MSTSNVMPVEQEVQGNESQNVNVVETNNVSYQNVIKKLIAAGCKKISQVKIKNVNFTEKDNYTMVSFILGSAIRGFVSEDNGATYVEGMTKVMFTSLYAITGAFKEDENLGWMANAILEKPQALNLILNGASIDILQQFVKAGDEVKNPFSSNENAEPVVYDHDVIINHVIGFKLGPVGEKMADKLADKLLGF